MIALTKLYPSTTPVLDPPICGNPIVAPVHANRPVGCNQAVFSTTDGSGTVVCGGVVPDGRGLVPQHFVGVAMSNYNVTNSDADLVTERSHKRVKLGRATDSPAANISVTVAGSATLSLGHHGSLYGAMLPRGTIPRPGQWVAFDFRDDSVSSVTSGRKANAANGVITYSPRVCRYDAAKEHHHPFGICLSVAVSPRSEITVLLRKDVYENDMHSTAPSSTTPSIRAAPPTGIGAPPLGVEQFAHMATELCVGTEDAMLVAAMVLLAIETQGRRNAGGQLTCPLKTVGADGKPVTFGSGFAMPRATLHIGPLKLNESGAYALPADDQVLLGIGYDSAKKVPKTVVGAHGVAGMPNGTVRTVAKCFEVLYGLEGATDADHKMASYLADLARPISPLFEPFYALDSDGIWSGVTFDRNESDVDADTGGQTVEVTYKLDIGHEDVAVPIHLGFTSNTDGTNVAAPGIIDIDITKHALSIPADDFKRPAAYVSELRKQTTLTITFVLTKFEY
jgi:hypothetical protein